MALAAEDEKSSCRARDSDFYLDRQKDSDGDPESVRGRLGRPTWHDTAGVLPLVYAAVAGHEGDLKSVDHRDQSDQQMTAQALAPGEPTDDSAAWPSKLAKLRPVLTPTVTAEQQYTPALGLSAVMPGRRRRLV